MIACKAGQFSCPSALLLEKPAGAWGLASLAWNHMGEARCQLDS